MNGWMDHLCVGDFNSKIELNVKMLYIKYIFYLNSFVLMRKCDSLIWRKTKTHKIKNYTLA